MTVKTIAYEKELLKEIKSLPKEYVFHLLELARLYSQGVALKPAEESFRQGLKETLKGELHPVKTLWDGVLK